LQLKLDSYKKLSEVEKIKNLNKKTAGAYEEDYQEYY